LRDADQNQDGMLSLAEFREAWKKKAWDVTAKKKPEDRQPKKRPPSLRIIDFRRAPLHQSIFLSSKAGAAVMAAISVKGIDAMSKCRWSK
jgi:hypothetical protein